ncbi:MAG: S-methyl thiohydantoin desulfurase domain-containing protein, partial [Thermomicrobiales bacterium]
DEVLVTVPDLITMLDAETGEPITTEDLRYGFRVVVIGIPCDGRWRSAAGLELVGPGYFGYDVPYVPVEQRFG